MGPRCGWVVERHVVSVSFFHIVHAIKEIEN